MRVDSKGGKNPWRRCGEAQDYGHGYYQKCGNLHKESGIAG